MWCGPEGKASGVLLRAGEVRVGAELTRKRRLSARHDKELAKGPARPATALDVDRALNRADFCLGPTTPLSLLPAHRPSPDQVRNGPRTEVGGEGAFHSWRFWIDGYPTVSPYRAHAPRRRGRSAT